MFSNFKKRYTPQSAKGFTIIEVMIVLAIAGLIILIVFLAVPALQRNSRNTQRKSDIGRIASAAQTVINNQNGNLAGLTTAALVAEVGNLGYYQAANITVAGAATTTNANGTTVDTVKIYTGATCVTGNDAAGNPGQFANSTGASARGIAVVYSTEGGSANLRNCTSE